ncbi:hypothetical protein AYO40_03400 [Planctomycetaceae bacterium SCGC AG-212-D15]|nr:hypothetical protein AYO40_03400 [Planctomycetaceae bacterium SCGC AG-212-D15]
MNEGVSVNGDYSISAGGAMLLQADGDGIALCATDDDGYVRVSAPKWAALHGGESSLVLNDDGLLLNAGASGAVGLLAGSAPNSPHLSVGPDSIKLAVGPPLVGASLEMTATSIKLAVGEVSLALSLTGINESVLKIVTREAGATGHTFKAIETTIGLTAMGIEEKGLTKKESYVSKSLAM